MIEGFLEAKQGSETRKDSLQPLIDFIREQEPIIGESEEKRVKWLTELTPQELSQFLIATNKTVRGITGDHTFDGKGVRAGIGSPTPPDQQDKEELLGYALEEIQKRVLAISNPDEEKYQEILNHAAVILPTIVNKLHLFGDGNGKTSRLLRMIIRDGLSNANREINLAVLERVNGYSTSPARPIDRAIAKKLREKYGTESSIIEIDGALESISVEATLEYIKSIPNLDIRIADGSQDPVLFQEAVRLFAKANNIGLVDQNGRIHISLDEFLNWISHDIEKQKEFLEIYRKIRKEGATLWIDSLTGKTDLPLGDFGIERFLRRINDVREKRKKPHLNPDDVDTALKLQTALEEAQSPEQAIVGKVGLDSSLRPNNTYLDIAYNEPGTGKAKIFFVRNDNVGPNKEIVLSSGFVKAEPTGHELGSKLFNSLTRVLSALSTETGKVIVHPLYPTSDASRRFFGKQGYEPDINQHWFRGDKEIGPWYVRFYSPGDKIELMPEEQRVLDNFKAIRPDLDSRFDSK